MALIGIRWLEGATGLDITGTRKVEVESATVVGDNDDEEVLANDQILTFLEKELWQMERGVGRETIERVNDLKTRYVNGLNGTAFQNDQIVMLMDDLEEVRRAFAEVATEERRMQIVNLKLDISDRLTKRYMKMKDTRAAADELKTVISEIQLANFDFNSPPSAFSPATTDAPAHASPSPTTLAGGPGHDAPAPSTVTDAVLSGGGAGVRRRRFVSDSEVKAALRRRKGE